MQTTRARSMDPALHRLTGRYARRGLRIAATLVLVPPFGALAVLLAVGAPPFADLVAAVTGLALLGIRVLAEVVPRRHLGVLGGLIGSIGVIASVMTIPFGGTAGTGYTAGFVGVIPACVTVLALWGMREHLAWLGLTTLLLVAMLAGAPDSPAMEAARWPMLAGWLLGGLVSIAGQAAFDHGRRTIMRAARISHAGRAHRAEAIRRLRAVEAIGRALSEHGPTDATLDGVVSLLVDDFRYSHPAIYLGDEGRIRLGAQRGHVTPAPELPPGGRIEEVMRSRTAVLVTDLAAGEPGSTRGGPSGAVRSAVCVPLLAGNRVLGVLDVESVRALDDEDVRTVSIVADQVAAAIDLADRRGALQSVLDASPLAIASFTPDGAVDYWNAAAEALFGWPAEEALGGRTLLHDRDDPIAARIAAAVAGGRRVDGVEGVRRHRDGTRIPVRIFAAPSGDRPPHGTIAIYQDLSAEQAASAALVESEGRFETVVGALGEGVIVQGTDHAVTYLNAAASRILGQRHGQLAGDEALDAQWAAIREDGSELAPDAYPAALVLGTGEPVSGMTVGVRHPDGHLAWIEAGAVPLRLSPEAPPYAVVTSFADITERKRHEDEARLAERKVRSVLEQAPNPIVGVDTAGRITYANPRVADLFGYGPDELVGQPVERLVAEPFAADHARRREAYLRHPAPRSVGIGREIHARRRDGTLVPVEIQVSPVETPGGLEVYATLVDTTERRRIEAELLQAAKMDSIGRLAGGIAHDFNNLLTAILGYGRIAQETLPPDSPALADVDQMLAAADRAAVLTSQLLGFARKADLDPATHDLNAIVTGVEPLLRRLLGERVALVTHLDPATGHIRVDRHQVDQVLVNLAANARDAMPDGGTLVIETAALDRSELEGAGDLAGERIVTLVVSDTGIGMSESVRARVFEPFYTTKPFGEGTGLGLATTYGIVRQSGGTIAVESTPGAGTTFRICFPQVPPAEAGPVDGSRTVEGPLGARRTVLVVEDEESVRTLVARMLERFGCRVLQAPNGAAAMSLVASRLDEVDLLLTDVVMPGMRGPELAEALRVIRPDLPVVFMSGYAADDAGAIGIPPDAPLLGKPFSATDLRRTVLGLLPATEVAAGR